MPGTVGGIQNTITKAKESTDKFVKKLNEVNSQLLVGTKEVDVQARQEAFIKGSKERAKLLKDITFFKDPSIMSLISMLQSLNSFELCNPASFALNQAFPSGSEGADLFNKVQGGLGEFFNTIRNFSLTPGVAEVTGVTTDRQIEISRRNKFTATFPPLKDDAKYPIGSDTSVVFRTVDPKHPAHMTGRVVTIEGNSFGIDIDTASTLSPIKDDKNQLVTFNNFDVEFTKQQNSDIRELSQELASIGELLREIGFQDILNDLNSIPPNFPGVGKIREVANKIQRFYDNVGTPASQIGDEVDDASQFLAGGFTSRQVLEGSRLFADFQRKLEPILNFENTIVTGYKDAIENVNNLLRNVIPFEELSKFVKFIRDFVRIIQGVVSMLIVLLKTINGIIKIVTTILKVFKVVIKVIKIAIKVLPAIFLPVGVIQTFTDKIEQAEGSLEMAIKFLEVISGFIDLLVQDLQITKLALGQVIDELTKLAAKLGSCGALKGNGMDSAMAAAVGLVRDSLRGLTGAAPGEDYYPNDPNSPGGGIAASSLPDGVGSFVRLPNGELMFVNDSVIGFDADGNLIFFGDLTSLSTGVSFNNTLGQDFRNRNLKYYTFDKFRNSQASMLNEADRIANERNNRIKEVDPNDRFGNFAEKYKGYTIKIQEEIEDNVNAQRATRRRGIAFDSIENIVVSTDLTFSDNLSQIVNEVKFLIDQLIREGVIGINTTDGQGNEPSDDDVINIVEGIGGNPVAISNLRAEKNNKTAASLPDKPGKPTKSRIGNEPFESNADSKIPTRGKTNAGSDKQPIQIQGVAQAGIDAFVEATPELKSLANNLSTINRATTSQLSNILKEPGVENMTEEELVEKLKGDILSGIDPNPEKIEEVKAKTQEWYRGIRAKARVDFNQLAQAAAQTTRPKGGRPLTSGKPAPEFEPFVTKIELKEIPKWIKLLRRSKYTQAEIDAGLQGEGIRDKYEIKIDEDGKIDIRKKLAFKEDNFNKKR